MKRSFPVSYSTPSAHALIADVLPNYDISPPTACLFLHRGLNDTFLVLTKDDKYILRVYRHQWRSLPDVLYEVEALLHLQRHGVSVSAPIPMKNGTFVGTIGAPEGVRYFVLFTHAPGKELSYSAEEERDAYHFGKVTARIHAASDSFHTSHRRFALDLEHLLTKPLQAMQSLLTHRLSDWDYIVQLAEKLRQHVQDLPFSALETGFCHGDLHGWNAHLQDQTLTFFDFDCCGMGWRSYDIAVFRWGAQGKGKHNERWPAFLRGYREVRQLGTVDIQATDYFVAIRQVWLMGLQTGNGQDWGYAWMDDSYFEGMIQFLREWETAYLTTTRRESNNLQAG